MSETTRFELPETMTPAIADALGTMCFEAGPIAGLFRQTGEDIPRKAEAEQAFVLFWLLKLALEHGDGFRRIAGAEIQRRLESVPTRTSNTA